MSTRINSLRKAAVALKLIPHRDSRPTRTKSGSREVQSLRFDKAAERRKARRERNLRGR